MEDLDHFADYREGPPQVTPPVIDIPAELVLKLAIGMEEPVEVAKQHGITPEQFAALCAWDPFMVQVNAKKAELKQQGFTFRLQNAMYAEEIGKKLFLAAMGSDTTIPQLLEAYKTTTKFADLEPKPSAAVQAGPGFSITINLAPPQKETHREPVVIEQGASAPGPVQENPQQVPRAAGELGPVEPGRASGLQPGLPARAG
jgi:hypothetical protein